jgi:hypothetical protein
VLQLEFRAYYSEDNLGSRAKRSVEFGRRPIRADQPNTPLFLPILQSKPSSAGSSVKAGKLNPKHKSKSGRLGKGLKGGAKLALLYFTLEGLERHSGLTRKPQAAHPRLLPRLPRT